MCLQIGEMELDCPGCCGESFKCSKTLKTHLLHLLNKLRCPQCQEKFNDLLTLANHLGECGDAQVDLAVGVNANAVENDEIQVSTRREPFSAYCNQGDTVSEVEETPSTLETQSSDLGLQSQSEKLEDVTQSNNIEELRLNVLIKNELAENTNLQEQQMTLLDNDGQSHILIMSHEASSMLEEQEIVTIQNDDGTISFTTPIEQDGNLNQNEGKESDDETEIYSCNACGISFTSVHEHIRNFHSDQDVVVEVAEAGAENKEDDQEELSSMSLQQLLQDHNTKAKTSAAIPSKVDQEQHTDNKADQDLGRRRVITESGSIVETEFKKSKAHLKNVDDNTLTMNAVDVKRIAGPPGSFVQQQCVDKDGRFYTRRFVQIEKFWEDKEDKLGNVSEVETVQESPVEEQPEEYILGDCEPGVTTVYHCALCYTQHLTMAEFDTHICKQPNSDPSSQVFSCDHCPVKYSSLKSLCAHKKVHKKLKSTDTKRINVKLDDSVQNMIGPFKCGVCDTVFPTNKSLRLHRRMHDPVKMRTIEAPVEYPPSLDCEPTLRDPMDKYHCIICDKYIHVGYRRIHEKFHSSTQDYNCDICNRKFFTAENLVMHMNVHSTEKIQPQRTDKLLPYNCLYCPRQFARPHEKVKHERIHTGEKPHSCEICGKSFRVSYCLTLHMRTHTGARPYICSHCGKRFKAHSVYNHHLLTHSEVRAYKCPFCPKAFKTSVQLAGHKNSHTKPFSCTECNRPFASLYAVRVHTETHKRQNNLKFSCTLCGASYARAFALKDHIRAHESITKHVSDHPYVQLVEVELERDTLSEENDAAMNIIPKSEHSIEVEELTLGPDDQDMELMQ